MQTIFSDRPMHELASRMKGIAVGFSEFLVNSDEPEETCDDCAKEKNKHLVVFVCVGGVGASRVFTKREFLEEITIMPLPINMEHDETKDSFNVYLDFKTSMEDSMNEFVNHQRESVHERIHDQVVKYIREKRESLITSYESIKENCLKVLDQYRLQMDRQEIVQEVAQKMEDCLRTVSEIVRGFESSCDQVVFQEDLERALRPLAKPFHLKGNYALARSKSPHQNCSGIWSGMPDSFAPSQLNTGSKLRKGSSKIFSQWKSELSDVTEKRHEISYQKILFLAA